MRSPVLFSRLFSFTAPPPTEIYTLSLHDALPILLRLASVAERADRAGSQRRLHPPEKPDRAAVGDDRRPPRPLPPRQCRGGSGRGGPPSAAAPARRRPRPGPPHASVAPPAARTSR